MKLVTVKFNGIGKEYTYVTSLNLEVGKSYNIVADGTTTYNSPVTVVKINTFNYNSTWRKITKATPVNSARPKDGLNKVIFDEWAGVTVALWCDGTKTIVRCQEGDTFDKEKAVALCYMKKVLGNRGSFNETLKKWVK
jgi:hypothetical protein